MAQDLNSELFYLFDSLALHRAKYLKLLTEVNADEERTNCEKAIQFYLSAILMLKEAHKGSNQFTRSFKSIFNKFASQLESKSNPDNLQTT